MKTEILITANDVEIRLVPENTFEKDVLEKINNNNYKIVDTVVEGTGAYSMGENRLTVRIANERKIC